MQREGVSAGQIVPQLFEPDRGLGISFCPQQGDHLSKGCYSRPISTGDGPDLIEKTPDHGGETLRVRPAIAHEPGKCLGRIDHNQPSQPDRAGHVEATLFQSLRESITVGPGRDHNGRIPGPERGADKTADRAQQHRILGIKLDHVTMRNHGRATALAAPAEQSPECC